MSIRFKSMSRKASVPQNQQGEWVITDPNPVGTDLRNTHRRGYHLGALTGSLTTCIGLTLSNSFEQHIPQPFTVLAAIGISLVGVRLSSACLEFGEPQDDWVITSANPVDTNLRDARRRGYIEGTTVGAFLTYAAFLNQSNSLVKTVGLSVALGLMGLAGPYLSASATRSPC